MAYARRLFPIDIRLLCVAPPGTSGEYLRDKWGHLGEIIDGRLQQHNNRTEIRNYVREVFARASSEHTLVDVIIPETVTHPGWRHFIRNLKIQRIKAMFGVPPEIMDSPYRQIARPVHSLVREILEEGPRTFVTIVLPEFIVQKWWHRLLHNQTALTLKDFLVRSVPYRL